MKADIKQEAERHLMDADLATYQAKDLAEHLEIGTTRSLTTALQNANTSFADLVQAERVRRYKKTNELCAKRIAGMLGYTASTAFYRWHHRTYDLSFKEMKRDLVEAMTRA